MGYGLRVEGPAGNVVLDDELVTLAVAESGYLPAPSLESLTPWLPGFQGLQIDPMFGVRVIVTFRAPITSNSPPLIAFIPRGGRGMFHALQPLGSPGHWTGFEVGYFNWTSNVFANDVVGPTPAELSWLYVAANPEECPLSAERYGMRVWTAQGKLAFDSGTPIIRVLGRFGGWSAAGSHIYGSQGLFGAHWAYPGSRNHGFFASTMPMQQVDSASGAWMSPRIGFVASDSSAISLYVLPATWQCHSVISRNQSSFGFNVFNRYLGSNSEFKVYAVEVIGL